MQKHFHPHDNSWSIYLADSLLLVFTRLGLALVTVI